MNSMTATEIVEGHPGDGVSEVAQVIDLRLGGISSVAEMVAVQPVHESLEELHGGALRAESAAVFAPVAGMQVLDDELAASLEPEEQRLVGLDDVIGPMRAVVDDDIEGQIAEDAIEHRLVGTIGDVQAYVLVELQLAAVRIDVDADDAGSGWEIFLPDLKRPAVLYADFQQRDRLASGDEGCKL